MIFSVLLHHQLRWYQWYLACKTSCFRNILLLLTNLSQKTFRRLSLTNNLPVTQKPRAAASNVSYDMSICGLDNIFIKDWHLQTAVKFPTQNKSLNLITTFLDYQIHLIIGNTPLFSPKLLETRTTKTTITLSTFMVNKYQYKIPTISNF